MQMVSENANEMNIPPYLKSEFFSSLSAPALADFELLLHPTLYPAGAMLFSETEPAAGIVIVAEGEVKLSINSSDGHRLSFHIAKAGEVLGLSSTLSGGAYEMTAEVLYPARIAHVTRQVFLQFLTRHPEAYQAVARYRAQLQPCLRAVAHGGSVCIGARAAGPPAPGVERAQPEARDRLALPPVAHARGDRRIHRRLARDGHTHPNLL